MKDLKDLDWRLMFPDVTELHITVSIHVIDELDKLKTDRSERKRRRALAALKIVDQAETGEITLREKPYRVTLATPRFGEEFLVLDRSRADDRLVAHVVENGKSILVSNDRGPRMKLISLGAAALAPPDAFRLPVEESELEKENRRLRAEIKAMADDRPRMKLKLLCPSHPIVLKKQVLPPLAEDLSRDLIQRVLAASPKLRKNTGSSVGPLNARRSFDWARYKIEYVRFATAVERHVATIHERINAIPVPLPVPFEIINAGPVTLQNAAVLIKLEGPARLFVEQPEGNSDDGDDDDFYLAFPSPPRLSPSFAMPRMRAIPFSHLKMLPMPGALTFEWDILPDEGEPRRANLSNREFRVGKRHLETIFIIPEGPTPLEVTLTFDLEATHLSEVCQETFRVIIESKERDWTVGDTERLEALVPEGCSEEEPQRS